MTSVRVAQILSGIVPGGGPVEEMPSTLVLACSSSLPVSGAGIVLMTDSGPAGVVAVSDAAVQTMEELQFTLGEGPCVDCYSSGRPELHPDLSVTGPPRWPGFAAGALEAGIRAIFAFPLRTAETRLGVLELYRDSPGGLGDDDLVQALAFADAATAVLLLLQGQATQTADPSQPATIAVLEDRAEVHQATGVISVQAGVTPGQALALLRARAFAAERPIVELARAVLAHEIRFSTMDGQDFFVP